MDAQRQPDTVFEGSIPEVYDEILVPLIFEVYAVDIARRLVPLCMGPLLEVAAGTGVVTRQLAARLDESVAITATDLSTAMLDRAAAIGTSRGVRWQQADAMELPFADDSFDAVVCQFGAMFFPDRPAAYAEVLRVLRPGGVFMFNVWTGIEDNDFARIVVETIATMFPENPPNFIQRIPHGYNDRGLIQSDLAAAGFTGPVQIELVEARSLAASPHVAAIGYCHGTPMRNEIVARDPTRLDEATTRCAEAIERDFGTADIDGKISALVVTVMAP